jgi:hypothetical protein
MLLRLIPINVFTKKERRNTAKPAKKAHDR